MKSRWIVAVILLLSLPAAFGQASSFFKPADSLVPDRFRSVAISQAAAMGGALAGLHIAWYQDYPKSKFHFIDDNDNWLQVDKAGHMYSAYHLSRLGAGLYQWSGASHESQLIYGAGSGLLFLTAVEVMDGYSSEWGASWGDVGANVVGTGLFVAQEMIWKEQRIVPKFSFHSTRYSDQRPETFGRSLPEQILKDYNGQTYWLSFNIDSFKRTDVIPAWLNVAIGYGADGMLEGAPGTSGSSTERIRQYYLSLDIDLSRIKTKSAFMRTILEVVNTIKIPAPTVEISSKGTVSLHAIYF